MEINDDLLQVVYLYLKFHPDSKKLKNKKYDFHFLVNSNGDPIDKSQSMTTILNKIFNKKINNMNNEIGRKITSLTLMTIMLAGGMFAVVPAMVPAAHAANANLFVSAENSQFNNYMSGPQVVEVVVRGIADIGAIIVEGVSVDDGGVGDGNGAVIVDYAIDRLGCCAGR